jgi:hypothetical protein
MHHDSRTKLKHVEPVMTNILWELKRLQRGAARLPRRIKAAAADEVTGLGGVRGESNRKKGDAVLRKPTDTWAYVEQFLPSGVFGDEKKAAALAPR